MSNRNCNAFLSVDNVFTHENEIKNDPNIRLHLGNEVIIVNKISEEEISMQMSIMVAFFDPALRRKYIELGQIPGQ